MACTVQFVYSFTGPPQARQLQVDALNDPPFCEEEFFVDTTRLNSSLTGPCNPADGLHGPPPLVNFFSPWRISAPLLPGVVEQLNAAYVPLDQSLTYPAPIRLGAYPPIGPCAPIGNYLFEITTLPLHGTVSPLSGTLSPSVPTVVYTPDPGFVGTDVFAYRIKGNAFSGTTFSPECDVLSESAFVFIAIEAAGEFPLPPSDGGLDGCASDLAALAAAEGALGCIVPPLLMQFPFILGDRTTLTPLWENATLAEREYGYLADRVTGLFGNGDAGKQL